MEKLVEIREELSALDLVFGNQKKELIFSALKKFNWEFFFSTCSNEQERDFYSTLRPQEHAILQLFFLHMKMRMEQTHFHEHEDFAVVKTQHEQFDLLKEICTFLSHCDLSQLHQHLKLLCNLCHAAVNMAIDRQISLVCLNPFRRLINAISSSDSSFTPIHSYFALAALKCKAYHTALELLDKPIFEVDPNFLADNYKRKTMSDDYMNRRNKSNPRHIVKSIHILKYFYYGGMIYVGLKKYQQALDFFLMVMTVPASTLSEIAVEAYKKYILVSLILHGKLEPLPKYTPTATISTLSTFCEAYTKFAKVFQKMKQVDKLTELANGFQENLALVAECLRTFKIRKIQRLTLTYMTVSLLEVANTVGLANEKEAELFLVELIEANAITATISMATMMITFEDEELELDSSDMLEQLHSCIQNSICYSQKLQLLDEEISTSSSYVKQILSDEPRESSFAPVGDIRSFDEIVQ